MPQDDEAAIRRTSWDANPPSPLLAKRPSVERNEPSDVYGVHLLAYLSSEIQQRVRSRLVIPIAVLAGKADVSFFPFLLLVLASDSSSYWRSLLVCLAFWTLVP